MSDFLPLEIPTERVKLREAGNGYMLDVYPEDEEPFGVWLEIPDGVYDQFMDNGIMDVDDDGYWQSEYSVDE